MLYAMILVALAFLLSAAVLTPSNRYFNTSGCTFTPSGGTALPITGVTNFGFDEGISKKKEGGDFDQFPTVQVTDWIDPTVTIETLDAAVLAATLASAVGALVIVLRDAKNGVGAGGGAKQYTLSNCTIQTRGHTAAFREFAKQNLTFGGISADGATHPMAISAL